MIRTAVLLSLLVITACKGKEVIKPDQATEKELERCRAEKAEKDKLIVQLQDENTRLQMKKGGGGEVIVAIEGNNFTVRPGKPGDAMPIDPKVAEAAAREFIDVVDRSRGAIQKCYEQALKKSSGLQAQPVKLTVFATFTPAGAYQTSSTAPSLGEPFDGCFRGVAAKWTLTQSSPAMAFRSFVNLTPS